MSVTLQIPSEITQALRLPPQEHEHQLLIELAVALYAREMLAFGKARELAGMNKYDFGHLLSQRAIPRHYYQADLDDDLAYANH